MNVKLIKTASDSTILFLEQKRKLERKGTKQDLVGQITKETIKFIKNIRALREGSKPPQKKTPQKNKSSTLIIGAKCKNGVVIIADKRTMRGTEYTEEKKISEFYKVAIAFAGLTGMKDKFLELVEEVLLSSRAMNLSETIIGVEDAMALLTGRYEKRLGQKAQIGALLSGLERLTSGKAKLYHVIGNGYTEEVKFLCIGHGAPYATSLAQGLYQPNLLMEEMAEIGIFLSYMVENVDSSVGGVPDVVFVKNNEGIRDMEKKGIEVIYKNAKQISKKLTEILPKAIKTPKILYSPKTINKPKTTKKKKTKK